MAQHKVRRPMAMVAIAALAALVAACGPLPPMPPGGEAADCRDVAWGSGAKAFERMASSPVTGVRAGEHRCFDRVVIDLSAPPAAGWVVRYGSVEEPGSGAPVTLDGAADLEVIVRAPAYRPEGAALTPTYAPADPDRVVSVTGFETLRQVAFAGSFEGQSSFGVGVRARLPFRVWATESGGRARLVVDVAHRWP